MLTRSASRTSQRIVTGRPEGTACGSTSKRTSVGAASPSSSSSSTHSPPRFTNTNCPRKSGPLTTRPINGSCWVCATIRRLIRSWNRYSASTAGSGFSRRASFRSRANSLSSGTSSNPPDATNWRLRRFETRRT